MCNQNQIAHNTTVARMERKWFQVSFFHLHELPNRLVALRKSGAGSQGSNNSLHNQRQQLAFGTNMSLSITNNNNNNNIINNTKKSFRYHE